ncbi:MAG: dTMP kinase [Actinomycetia bacterium]|nr:dTMP kinase [Actinomycetes bacterium]
MSRGALITFEGGEGAGKSTQIETLKTLLESWGHEVMVVREPGGTALGEQIRTILLSHEYEKMSPQAELLLYEAARAQIVSEVIEPALEEGIIVLCDRFYDSTSAYQGYGRALGTSLIDELNRFASGGLTPDATLIIDLPVEIGLDRAGRKGSLDRLETAGQDFHEAVRAGFLHIAAQDPDRVHLIDGTRPLDEVAADVERIVTEALARV